MIAVVDYDAGNLRSVANALTYIGTDFFISQDPKELNKGDKLIVPGVGHAKSAMENLKACGIDEFIKNFAATGKPLFGICLGSQILLEHSEEGDTACLGLISGKCKKLSQNNLKVPHIGWNKVQHTKHPLFKDIPVGTAFYFVHSYYTEPAHKENTLCLTEYGVTYASGVVKENIAAVQFHPERSGLHGLTMLKNFANAQSVF